MSVFIYLLYNKQIHRFDDEHVTACLRHFYLMCLLLSINVLVYIQFIDLKKSIRFVVWTILHEVIYSLTIFVKLRETNH